MAKTIGIFAPGQAGDILEASSVLKYRKELWGDAKIVWYIEDRNRDLLKHQDIELRTFPRGFGYPEMVVEENRKLIEAQKEPIWEDWAPLVDENNRLNLELKKAYPSLADVDEGYFPLPHQMSVKKRHGIEYSNVSKKVFGVPDEWEWHSFIKYTEEEEDIVEEFFDDISGKTLFIESFGGSGQSIIDEEAIKWAMDKYKEYNPNCNYLFGSHKFLRAQEEFPEWLKGRADVRFCKEFSVRMCGLIANWCDAMISVSSGITVAASAWWHGDRLPIVQVCGSEICSTKAISHLMELITTDDNPNWKEQFKEKLIRMI